MSTVALVRCETYSDEDVKMAVEKGINLLGGAQRFVSKGEKVLLKPNLLAADTPEKCVTTHPSVFRAVAEIFLSQEVRLSYGDSPAFGSTAATAKKAGIAAVADDMNIAAADFKTAIEVFNDKARQNKKFMIAKGVKDNDAVISISKLKTHGFEKYTGAVKNQFGCIPGLRKGEFHIKLPDANAFAQMLVDLNSCINPRLYIMDGIMAMDGNGPRGGKPKKMNILLFSEDPIALDATVCRIIALDPLLVPTIKCGFESGSGTYKEDQIDMVGDDLNGFIVKDFNINRSPIKPFKARGIMRFFNNRLVLKPVISKEKCIKCGVCINVCPTNPKSVNWPGNDKKGVPVHNYKSCIRCYCCQELCPESAIVLKPPFIRRIMRKQ